jgi:hypothetical protein
MTDDAVAHSLYALDDYLATYVISDDTPFQPLDLWNHIIELDGVVTHLARLADSSFRKTAANYRDSLYSLDYNEQMEKARELMRIKTTKNDLPKEVAASSSHQEPSRQQNKKNKKGNNKAVSHTFPGDPYYKTDKDLKDFGEPQYAGNRKWVAKE